MASRKVRETFSSSTSLDGYRTELTTDPDLCSALPGSRSAFITCSSKVKSIEGWKAELRAAYKAEGGNPGPSDEFPRFAGRITFINTALVARKVFDERNR